MSVTLLAELVFRDALGLDPDRLEGHLDFAKSVDDAVAELEGGDYRLAAFLGATPMAEVQAVAAARRDHAPEVDLLLPEAPHRPRLQRALAGTGRGREGEPRRHVPLLACCIAYSGALMPGPMLTVVVAETPRQGARAGPLVVLGHAILELTLLILLVIGLGPVPQAIRPSRPCCRSPAGSCSSGPPSRMIVALARHRVSIDWEGGSGGSKARAVLMGIVSSLANPYWTIWWVTIGLGLLTKAYALGAAGIVVFYLGHITGDLTWYSLVSGALAAGKRYITLGVYRAMLSVAATFLLALALWFLASGVRAAGR